MKPSYLFSLIAMFVLLVATSASAIAQGEPPASAVTPLGTAITYQGRLRGGPNPASGNYDFQFILYNASAGGSQVGSIVVKEDVLVTSGYFTVQLDFGANAFGAKARWLEVGVRPGASTGDYTILSPRQPLTPAPGALYASNAGNANSVPWSGLTGVPAGFADGIDNDTLASLSCSNGQIPEWTGSAWVCGDKSNGSFWSLTGNAGTDPAANYLGTSDNQPLELRVNGQRVLRLEPSADSPNLLGGYSGNTVMPGVYGATISGGGYNGRVNSVAGNFGTIGGGFGNQIIPLPDQPQPVGVSSAFSTVGGGYLNTAGGQHATVGGGSGNSASQRSATVSGGEHNAASGQHATVAGGFTNTASNDFTTVGGGSNNTASGIHDTVGGGSNNTASGWDSTVGGGESNTASDDSATVGGGIYNEASGYVSTVSGGTTNKASGIYAAVGGGSTNTASGQNATVGGGYQNTAGGDYSLAAGNKAIASSSGSFVWSDANNVTYGPASYSPAPGGGDNSFNVRATGGVYFVTGINVSTGVPTAGVYLSGGGSGWNTYSDPSFKENFKLVDSQQILTRLAGVPISTWNYKSQDSSIQHIGPMAPAFNAAFGVGEPDKNGDLKYINSLDADGVALASIQALYQRSQDQASQIKALQEQLAKIQKAGVAGPSGSLPVLWIAIAGFLGLLVVILIPIVVLQARMFSALSRRLGGKEG